jgi:hypothetical protein
MVVHSVVSSDPGLTQAPKTTPRKPPESPDIEQYYLLHSDTYAGMLSDVELAVSW